MKFTATLPVALAPVALLIALLGGGAVAAAEIGHLPPRLELSGDKGGRMDGAPWSSDEIRGKVYTLMYVDPDEVKLNEHVEQALDEKTYSDDHYGAIAVVNLAATWKPKSIINFILRGKQKEFPDVIYVRDRHFHLADAWGLKRKGSYAVLAFAADGRLIFAKDGRLDQEEVAALISVIEAEIAKL